MTIKKVRRRDGTIVDFDKEKITDTIFKAVRDRRKAEELSNVVVRILEEEYAGRIPTLKDIHNVVGKVLAEQRKRYKMPKPWRPHRQWRHPHPHRVSFRLPRLLRFVKIPLLIILILVVEFFVLRSLFDYTIYILAAIVAIFLDWKIFQRVSRIRVHTDARLFGLKLLSGLIAGAGGVLLVVLFFMVFPFFWNPFNPPWSPTNPPVTVIVAEIFIGTFALGLILVGAFLEFKFMRRAGIIIFPR